ncbi:MAG: anion permease [Fibrobacteria bacterium]|nr:anion permease [Fibrobacteria bacterium]
MAKVLLIDDEDKFLNSLSQRLTLRKYPNITLNNGEDAVKTIRKDNEIDVVILDRKMPGMSGEEVLKEIKKIRPEVQVIIMTGHGSMESAIEAGKLKAFRYLEKPCDIDTLIQVIESARVEKTRVMATHEIPIIKDNTFKSWVTGSPNYRPGLIALGIILFLCIIWFPTSNKMLNILSFKKTGQLTDLNAGYTAYAKMQNGESIADFYSGNYKIKTTAVHADGEKVKRLLTPEETAFRLKVMLGILVVAAFFWATGAIPMGITALLVGVVLYFFGILRPDDIAKAYAKDAVIFIFGILAMSIAIAKTGLDRRIGIILLGTSKSIPLYLFVFLPLLAISCSFLSEHALVAFIMPIIMIVYVASIRTAGLAQDHNLVVMLVLSLCFAANSGGPGSPAAGGRNAVMLGILGDYGHAPSFGEWVMYGLPFVPVMAIVIGLYFYLALYRKVKVKNVDISKIVKKAAAQIGPMNKNEYITLFILILLVTLWVTGSDLFGMGGPVILCLVLLNVFRIVGWREISRIPWEVVALYASACALGKGLAVTGAALFLGQSFIDILPEFMKSGEWLAVAASLFTGLATNFMSDGATVSTIGPITVPMAIISDTSPLMVGLATAFASSFANMLIIGTPNNALAYALSKDPITGIQMIKLSDFFKHGFIVLLLCLGVLWGWTIFGYWQWIGFN